MSATGRADVAATEPEAEPLESPTAGARLLGWLDLEPRDLALLSGLLAVAFVLRFFSPLMPDFIAHPLAGAPLSICVNSTPVDPQGHPGTLCGLSYPFQRGYADQAGHLSPPDGEIFDEIYFGVFAHNDLKGISYFDPEPPLSKEFIAAGEWLYGWWRVTFEGYKGSYADAGFTPFGWRIMACVIGSLCPPMIFLVARRLWPNRFFALAAGVLTCFDGMFFVQSRIGMIDIFPIFLILLAYYAFLTHLRSRTPRESLITLLATGVVLGLAVSAKWIALAAMASIVFFLFARWFRRHVNVRLGSGESYWEWGTGEGPALPGGASLAPYLGVAVVALVAIPAAIYVASWFPFFMRGQFHTLADLAKYQRDIFHYHATLTATHPYGSPPWSWPFLYRPVAYYFESQGLGVDQWSGHTLEAWINNLGNPWIWWSSLPCLPLLLYFVFRHRSFPAALITVGFVTQYLPWFRITRVIFMYHMFGGLIFMVLALAFVLAKIAATPGLSVQLGESARLVVSGRLLAYAHLAIAVLFFLYFYPLWTGLPMGDTALLGAFPGGKAWFPRWV
jgi:dolichyl-phosphate-mannose--protein O-mannosyl transferase